MSNDITLSRDETMIQLERCRRLLSNTELMLRLPDKGKSVKTRMSTLIAWAETEGKKDIDAFTSVSADVSTLRIEEERRSDGEKVEVMAIVEKYKNYRSSVEDKVRQMYEGALTEKEIERILQDIPPNYLLTLPETEEMSRNLLQVRRKYELENLRVGTSRAKWQE